MSNPQFVNSRVERIEQQNGPDGVNLALSVVVTGFAKGESVTITGYATQNAASNGGSMVSIYDTQTVDSVSFDGVANLTVNVTLPEPFKPDEEITTVISAAKVWMTVLKRDAGVTSWTAEYYTGGPGQNGQDGAWADR